MHHLSAVLRPLLRYRLRTLLLLMVAAGLVFAWVERARQQQQVVARMQRSNPGAVLLYDHEVDAEGGLTQSNPPGGPAWLRERWGIDYTSHVAGVDMFYPTDADLQQASQFSRLRRLFLDRGLDVTDAGLAHVAGMKHLRMLALGEADQVTDAGLRSLARLQGLAVLKLDIGHRMTPEGIEALRRGLPNCRIEIRGEDVRQQALAFHAFGGNAPPPRGE